MRRRICVQRHHTGALHLPPRHGGGDWTVSDWHVIGFSTKEEWQRAVTIFEDRLRGRFLRMIDLIKDEPYAGFAVLALDCLLIETLQQFRMGVPDSDRKTRAYFVSFLTETSFKLHFCADKSKGSLADMFYKQIRCGILHQAETKHSSRVVTTGNAPVVQPAADGKGIVVNRRKFHDQLVREFKDYVRRLRTPLTSEDEALRKKFKKKMDFICRVPGQS